jgi:hypothetical protein
MNGAQITGNQSVANLGLDWNIQGTGDSEPSTHRPTRPKLAIAL